MEPLTTALKDVNEDLRNTVAEALKNLGADCKMGPGEGSTSDEVETVLQNDASMRLEGEDRCSDSESLIDIDGNVYKTVTIGKQIWMAENLKVTRYRYGDEIPEVTDLKEWREIETGARCSYNNDEDKAATYGYLYNWYAVNDKRNIAPAGWRVPSDEDWKTLEMHLGMSRSGADEIFSRGSNVGSKLAGNASLWRGGLLKDHSVFGKSGFSALPAGSRTAGGYFENLGGEASFWSAREYGIDSVWCRTLRYFGSDGYYGSDVIRSNNVEQDGLSVRLVKNE